MGRLSTKEDKTIYQICREKSGLSREKASDLMEGMPASRIEKSNTKYSIQRLLTSCKWPIVINALTYATIFVLINVRLATAMFLPFRSPRYQTSFWKRLPV